MPPFAVRLYHSATICCEAVSQCVGLQDPVERAYSSWNMQIRAGHICGKVHPSSLCVDETFEGTFERHLREASRPECHFNSPVRYKTPFLELLVTISLS
jgi:hypothetical protein